jgi:hypothetical protein
MYSFIDYVEGKWSMEMPDDSVPLFLCFVFTVLFDLLQRKNENPIINGIEYLIGVIALPVGIILYGIKHEVAFPIVALIFSSLIFCLKLIHLIHYLFLSDRKKQIISKKEKKNDN